MVLALDATRDHRDEEIRMAIRGLVARGDILLGGDSLLVLACFTPSPIRVRIISFSFT